jgi:outer membrane protein OmpA-like peptidoglycan-associated protein/outer membrane protein W
MKIRLAVVLALTTGMVALTESPALANGEEAAPPPPAAEMMPPPPPVYSSAGIYVAAMGGANYVDDREIQWDDGGGFLSLIDQDVSYDWGWAAGGAIGYRTGTGVRAEIEGVYRQNSHDEWHAFGLNVPFDDGDITAISGMVNVLYDIDFGSVVVPYVGVGVGAALVEAEADLVQGNPFNFQDDAWAFAYQGIVGVNLRLDESVDLFADYRYFSTYGLHLEDNYFPGPVTTESDDDYRAHTVMAGLRFTFTEMPMEMPMAEPAPEPAPIPRQFMIFFDWDVDALSPEAKAIVADAANYALSGGIAQIVVTGHTDTSGSASYNVGLSKRRADNTAAELVANGVDAGMIGVAWEGETNPLVPTGDGVREPQNRRVEIVFP